MATNSSGPSQQSIFASGRPSTSSIAGYSPNNYSQGIGYSPSTPASPASSGIPSFRSLRSLLPFGSNKNATTTTTTSVSTSSPNPRSSFGAFSSVRRSMTRDRECKVSISNDAPVIAIEKPNGNPFPDDAAVLRRSVSLSKLEKLEKPLPSEPTPKDPSSTSLGDNLLPSSFTLRTPSPGPPLSAELSTIIEADNSGVSKHVAVNASPITTTNRNTTSTQEHNTHTHPHECDVEAMDLSTTHLADLVRDAIRKGDSLKDQWLNADKAVIIDGDEHPDMADTTFNMESVDRDLADLLSPHSAAKQVFSSASTSSPTPPKFPASPASRLPRARQSSSFLPRRRSSNPPPTPQIPIHHTHTPPPKPSPPVGNGYNALKPSSSPALPSASTSTPIVSRRNITLNHSPRLISPSSSSSRTAKVFAKQQPRSATPTREDGNSESTTERFLRDRSGSTSGILSPSPLGVGNSFSTLNRFASLRSASEYNPIYGRSHSRLTLSSDAGSGTPRRGSESFYTYGGASSHGSGGGGGGGGGSSYGHTGLMESPTFTASSGSRDRDTPKSSISTGPTSLADSFGYLGPDRERDRERELEMMREMKEKHGTEMGALLGALSDSQRTVRMLREENSDLRDRLERFAVAFQSNQELRRVCEDLQSECGSLRKDNTDLRKELVGLRGLARGGGNSSGVRTPVQKTVTNSSRSPLGQEFTSRVALEEEYGNTFIDHGSEVENHINGHGSSSPDISILVSPSSKKRRLSNSSSIFPIPASNMTLLLHEDVTSTLGSLASCRSSTGTDYSQYGTSLSPPPSICAAQASSASSQRIKTHVRSISHSPPVSYQNFTGNLPPNSSVISIGSISPSMVAGSPGSLFLRPEHEILLGDMESLDLGVRGDDGDLVDDNADGW